MKNKQKEAIERYQCPGCVRGHDISCFEARGSLECGKHVAGALSPGAGSFFLGLPNGFNRLGINKTKVYIFESLKDGWGFDVFNVPVWKHLDKHGSTLVRGISPRINAPFLHIFLEDCMDEINCLKITDEDIEGMD